MVEMTEATTAVWEAKELQIGLARQKILLLCGSAGEVARSVVSSGGEFVPYRTSKAAASIVKLLVEIAGLLGFDLNEACCRKLALNKEKYPVQLCEHEIRKYTELSDSTGVYKTNQSIYTNTGSVGWLEGFLEFGLAEIAAKSEEFVAERGWKRHDTKTNLALALCSEAGELADVVAWSGDTLSEGQVDEKIDKLSQEMADVTILLVRLVAVCGIELGVLVDVCREDTMLGCQPSSDT